MKVKLIQAAFGQPAGAEMDLRPQLAEPLIRRGAAVAVQMGMDSGPGITAVMDQIPERNKSMAARQAVRK